MGEKMKKAEAFKQMMKTKDYGDGDEAYEKMMRDNKIYKKLAKEATEEWLKEKEQANEDGSYNSR